MSVFRGDRWFKMYTRHLLRLLMKKTLQTDDAMLTSQACRLQLCAGICHRSCLHAVLTEREFPDRDPVGTKQIFSFAPTPVVVRRQSFTVFYESEHLEVYHHRL